MSKPYVPYGTKRYRYRLTKYYEKNAYFIIKILGITIAINIGFAIGVDKSGLRVRFRKSCILCKLKYGIIEENVSYVIHGCPHHYHNGMDCRFDFEIFS